ncbi:CDP-diacylglycerol--serine O-phosphatidyltransferase 1-like isoform X2 [Rutidosis leptorrhynchoides]|uniref:CDP-diacylglycerol--serine O-phosphatidyltransferase 1-like isoform X2 n=1 Tax=Rutidosis leptorrhynchoides TaxID=125765 RepID=UPI003A98E825
MESSGHKRERRKDYLVQQSSDDELDPWTAWAYKPRTITLLFIGSCILIWASGALDPESNSSDDIVTSVKRGIWAMICVFLAYCLLQAPSTLLIRPHPAIWRLVHGMAVIYLVALTFLLFQNRDDARQFMKYLHPDLGVELPERSYGADCRIYVPDHPTNRFINVYETLFDEFVPAHLFGWWGKAIMIRNQSLLWVLSIGFELMELTFRHMLPNFNECWWDSIILDILICNWLGIKGGMLTVRYFDGKTYEWVGISRQPNILGKVKRTLGQFTPAHWDKDEWHPFLGPWSSGVQFLPTRPKACEKGRSFLLAFACNLHHRTPYLHQIWARSVSNSNAQMAYNFVVICWSYASRILNLVDMAISKNFKPKTLMIITSSF